MQSRRSLFIRLTLCVLLGAITTWMVAWGLTTAVWAGWLKPGESSTSYSFTIDEPFLIERTHAVFRFDAEEIWTLSRLDVEGSTSQWVRTKADELLSREEQERSDQPESPLIRLQTTLVPGSPWAGQDTVTLKGKGLPSISETTTWVMIHRTSVGWPWRSLADITMIGLPTGKQTQYWNWPTFSRMVTSWKGRMSVTLDLPLQPVWAGFTLNTGFYGAIWALPLIGLPLLKQHRRRRKGHCPRCNYDLKRDLEHGCPECGWGKSAESR